MFCTKCGKFIKSGENFCPACGAQVADMEANRDQTIVFGDDSLQVDASDMSEASKEGVSGDTIVFGDIKDKTSDTTNIDLDKTSDIDLGSIKDNEIVFEEDEIQDFDFPDDMEEDNDLIFEEDDMIVDNDENIIETDDYYEEEPGNDVPVVGSNKKTNMIAIAIAVIVVIAIVVTAVVLSNAFSNTDAPETTTMMEETTEAEETEVTETEKAVEEEKEEETEAREETTKEKQTKREVQTKPKKTAAPVTEEPQTKAPQTKAPEPKTEAEPTAELLE